MDEFRRNFAPKTSISLSFSQENTQFYKRRVASAKFGYLWRRADNKWRYNFDLIDLNYVLMPSVDSSFISELKNEYIKSAYTNHMILSAIFRLCLPTRWSILHKVLIISGVIWRLPGIFFWLWINF